MSHNIDHVILRAMTLEELVLLGPLWEAAGLSYRPQGRDTQQNLADQWTANRDGFIGAFHGVDLVGSVLATEDGRRGWINRLVVHPDYRRLGLGHRLIITAEQMLKEKGLLLIAALVEDTNDASRAVFSRAGYELMPEVLYYSKRESPDA